MPSKIPLIAAQHVQANYVDTRNLPPKSSNAYIGTIELSRT